MIYYKEIRLWGIGWKYCKKVGDFLKKKAKIFGKVEIMLYLCSVKTEII